MSSPPVPAPGTLIDGKYRVERTLGQGGMGVVVEATHLALGKRVAVKLLRPDAASAEVRERFAREARIAAQIPGEHVAAVSDFGETPGGEPYLVMELLVGQDLEQQLAARRSLPVPEAVDTILQACEGVGPAHAAGLVHRDIKPANLFVVRRTDGSPLVKVLDFGLSKVTREQSQRLTATATSFGTPQYMSPEQIRSAKYVDARSDQHALAMVLFELVTGRPPYVAESVTGLMVEISMRDPPPMGDVPRGLEAAVRRALAKRPDDRFPDLGGFAEALAPFGGPGAAESARRVAAAFRGQGPAAGASPPQPERETQTGMESDPSRSSSRRTTALSIAVGAGLAIALGVALMARSFGRAPEPPKVAVTAASAAPTASPEPSASASATPAPSEPASAAAPVGSEPAPAAASASAASTGKPRAPRRPAAKPVDPARDVFGQRRK